MSESKSYDGLAKTLHWLIAVIVILMLIAGRTLEDLPLDERVQIIMVHSGLGTLVFVLMLARLAWRMTHTPPTQDTMPSWQEKSSLLVHWAFYGLLLLQPVFGLLQAAYIDYQVLAFGVLDYSGLAVDNKDMHKLFHRLHGLNATVLSLLVLIHAAAALIHHFYQKDNVLRRMWPRAKLL
jgi:cytochrome b561